MQLLYYFCFPPSPIFFSASYPLSLLSPIFFLCLLSPLSLSLLSQTKLKGMASGKGKDKDKDKEGKKNGRKRDPWEIPGVPPGEEVDATEAELVAILANQVVKEEKKKIRAGLKKGKKGRAKKKISKFAQLPVQVLVLIVTSLLSY